MSASSSPDSRRFPRRDRPGSGIYRGSESEGVAFDDFRATDEQEAHHRPHRNIWQSLRRLFGGHGPESLAQARKALVEDPTIESDRIRLAFEKGTLKISGSVNSRWMKEKVSERILALRIGPIKNELQIRPAHPKLPQEGELIP